MYGKQKFRILNNAIDAKKFIYNSEESSRVKKSLEIEDKFVIGHIGRFNTQKNHDFLIDIFENPTKYYLKDIPNIYKHFSEEFKNKLSDKTLKDLFYLANIGGVEKGAKISDLVNNI